MKKKKQRIESLMKCLKKPVRTKTKTKTKKIRVMRYS